MWKSIEKYMYSFDYIDYSCYLEKIYQVVVTRDLVLDILFDETENKFEL